MIRRRADDGVFAILYGVLVVVLIGVVALVLDIGTLRMDRRANRAAGDAAAIVGAAKLGLDHSSPLTACQQAMRYAETSLGISTPGSDNCKATFGPPKNPDTLCAAGTPLTASEAIGARTISVTWPVPDNSLLLTKPDVEQYGVDTAQPASPQDGVPCLRVAVSISQNTQMVFAAVWGVGNQTATSRSVALTVPDGGQGDIPAPLVVLDKHSCDALNMNGGGGGGGLVVGQSLDGTAPGAIAVDSDGIDDGTAETPCKGGGSIIDVPNNSHVWALDTATNYAKIYSYAKAVGQPDSLVYGKATVSGCTIPWRTTPPMAPPPNLCPIPVGHGRVGPAPWTNRYDCVATMAAPCPIDPDNKLPAPRDYVDQWTRYATGSVPPTFGNKITSCTLGNATYTGDTYTACPTLNVKGIVSIVGKFVATGSVSVTGCLLFNDTDTSHCTTPPALVDKSAPPPDGDNAYIGGGLSVSGGSNPSLSIRQSFVFVGGAVNINTTGAVSWVGPYADQATTCTPAASSSTAPSPGCFQALGLWAVAAQSSTSPDVLSGPSNTVVDGTWFMPNAYFKFAGSGNQTQQRAQFVARRLEVTGGGTLTMVPDSSRSTTIPGGTGQLIR